MMHGSTKLKKKKKKHSVALTGHSEGGMKLK
jgi:hypothetical protein